MSAWVQTKGGLLLGRLGGPVKNLAAVRGERGVLRHIYRL